MKKKKIIFMLGIFPLLLVDVFFSLGQIIPGFGEPVLPVLSNVPAFSFNDQEGRPITNKDLAGKVYVAEYFFTTCKGICPRLNSNIKDIAHDFAGESVFRILSYTVDPETDAVGRMR